MSPKALDVGIIQTITFSRHTGDHIVFLKKAMILISQRRGVVFYINPVSPPASSAVEVRKLIRDDLLIEIEAIAVGS